jgi:hypothetical protein
MQGGWGGKAFPHIDREFNVIFGGYRVLENRRQQKLIDRQVLVATNNASARTDDQSTRSPSAGLTSGSTLITPASTPYLSIQ